MLKTSNSILISADWHMNEDESSKQDDEDSDEDEESKRKKNAKKGGRSRKNPFDADGVEKSFVCDVCGAKYKTRPGLSYHVQKTHNMRLALNPTGTGSPMTIAMNKITREPIDSLNGDDNTNSIFESVYDGDNSSSMPQGSQSASTPLNQNTNSNQLKSSGNVPCLNLRLSDQSGVAEFSITRKQISEWLNAFN